MKHFGKIWFAVLAAAIALAVPGCKNGAGGGDDTGGDSATIMYRAVEDVATVSTSERAVLSWSKPAENWFGVRIEISPEAEGWVSTKIYKDEASVLVQGLSAETAYTITLITVDEKEKGTDKKTVLKFTTPKAPDPVIQEVEKEVIKEVEVPVEVEKEVEKIVEVEKAADTTPAGKVTGLTATAGNAMATLSWTNPTDDDLYGVEITVSGGTSSKSFVLKKPAAAYAVYGLANGTEHTFSVKSIDNSLNLSEAEIATATPADTSDSTAPANVTNLAASSIDTTVTLTWTDATDTDIFGYEITYAEAASSRAIAAMTAGSVFVAQGTKTYSATGLTDGKTYTFTVKSVDTSGNKSSGASATATITASGPHTHSFKTDWANDMENHWHASNCEHEEYVSVMGKHTLEDVTGIAVTCTTNGRTDTKCSVCGFVDHETTVYAAGHDWKVETETAEQVTSRCGKCNQTRTVEKTSLDELGTYRVLADDELESYGITATSVPPKIEGATYVKYGTWPQTLKKEGVDAPTVDKTCESITQGMFTYYRGDDGWWYCECKENAYGETYKYSDGTTVKKSSANSTKWFRVEPIVWRVVTDDFSGKSLLVAEKVLTANVQFYGSNNNRTLTVNGEEKTIYANNWKYSNVRAWLNGYNRQDASCDLYISGESTNYAKDYTGKGFLQTAFTAEQSLALNDKVAVKNDLDSTCDTKNDYVWDEDTSDSVFFLSAKEAQTSDWGFTDDNSRKRQPTDFALANNAYLSGTCSWWLRFPGDQSNNVRYVNYFGMVNCTDVFNKYVGIVPALCVTPPASN